MKQADRPWAAACRRCSAKRSRAAAEAAWRSRAAACARSRSRRSGPIPNQPRIHFSEESLDELADSIAERGVLQPILLRPDGDGFEIIAGERRWRAAQRARLHTIPAIVREIDDATTAELALIENIQREDLNAIEEAEGYQQLIERYGHSQDDVGKLVHKSRSHVANLLRLLDLPEFVRQSLLRGDISMGHARAVATRRTPKRWPGKSSPRACRCARPKQLAKRRQARNARPGERAADQRPGRCRSRGARAPARRHARAQGQGRAQRQAAARSRCIISSLDQLDMICQRLSGEPI